MGAAISREKNGTYPANNPAHLIGRGGAGEQVSEDATGLAGPGGAAILGDLDEANAAYAPDEVRAGRGNQARIGNHPCDWQRFRGGITGFNAPIFSLWA